MNKRNAVIVFGLLVSALCLWYFIHSIKSWGDLRLALRTARYEYLIPAVGLGLISHLVRAWRWHYLVLPLKKVRIRTLFSVLMISFTASNLLPGRVGELLRPAILQMKEGIKYSSGLATVVVERVLDLVALSAMLVFVFVVVVPNAPGASQMPLLSSLRLWGFVFGAVTAAGALFLVLLRTRHDLAVRILRFVLSPFSSRFEDWVIGLIEHFVEGLGVLASPRQTLIVCLQSVVVWCLSAIAIWVASLAFPGVQLPFFGAFFVMVCVALAVALPQAPGFIGVFHVATDKSLALYNVASGASKGFAIVLWAISILPVVAAGLICLWAEGMSFRQIRKVSKDLQQKQGMEAH